MHGPRPESSSPGPRWIVAAAAALCVSSACGSSSHESDPPLVVAQHCVSVRVGNGKGRLAAGVDGRYSLVSSLDAADRFFAKPSRLGRFLLYDQASGFLGANANGLERLAEPDDSAEWTLADRTLVGADFDGEPLTLESRPDTDCRPFPEAALDAEISPDGSLPRDPSKPVFGFADLHAHFGFPATMGGVVMAGSGFHRFGIEHALADCSYLHGNNGALDLLESQVAGGQHATAGYPSFPYWPNRLTATHMLTYWRWIERAHLAGLQLVVTDATGNRSYCQIMSATHRGQSDGDCSAHDETTRQVDYIWALQDYVDAQAGGPGLGWFRVVRSPAEARQVIAEGKLAVVLGIEYSELFDCREGDPRCTPEYVDAELQAVHDRGVRSLFPIHRFDNAFGGTRPDGGSFGAWMNLTSKISTSGLDQALALFDPFQHGAIGGHFWELEACPAGVRGTPRMRSMEAFVDDDLAFVRQALLGIPVIGPTIAATLDTVIRERLAPLDDYADFQGDVGGCNPRALTDIGRHLLDRMMDLGMIIEIDHTSQTTLAGMLEAAEARGYSGIVSSHAWLEDQEDIRQRIFALGGVMAPFNSTPAGIADRVAQYRASMAPFPFAVGVGIGTDVQGIAGQSEAGPGVEIHYPFTSVDGEVTFTRPRTGDRTFDFMTEGMAHYGLFPEWIEGLRQVSAARGDGTLDTFFHSAEAYLQMWERAEATVGESSRRASR